MAIAGKHGLRAIENCAERLSASRANTQTGAFGDVGAVSCFGNKTITTGKGGPW